MLVNDFIGLQKQEFSPRFKIIILLNWPKIHPTSKAHKFIKIILAKIMLQHVLCFKLFAEKKPFLFDVLFIAGMFAKTSFLIYLIVLIAVASSFVSVALTSNISISQLCCCCLGNGGFISKK